MWNVNVQRNRYIKLRHFCTNRLLLRRVYGKSRKDKKLHRGNRQEASDGGRDSDCSTFCLENVFKIDIAESSFY